RSTSLLRCLPDHGRRDEPVVAEHVVRLDQVVSDLVLGVVLAVAPATGTHAALALAGTAAGAVHATGTAGAEAAGTAELSAGTVGTALARTTGHAAEAATTTTGTVRAAGSAR